MDRWRGCRPSSCTSSNRRRNGNAGNYAAPRAQIGDARRGRRAPGCRSDRFKDFDGSALAGWTPRRQAPALAPPLARPRCAKNVRSPSRASRRWSPGWCLYGQIYEKKRMACRSYVRQVRSQALASRRRTVGKRVPPPPRKPTPEQPVASRAELGARHHQRVHRQRRGQSSPFTRPGRRLDALEQRVDALADEMPAAFDRGPRETAQIRSESTGGHKVRPQRHARTHGRLGSRHSDRQ